MTIGVSVANLAKLLRNVSAGDELYLGYDLADPDRVKIALHQAGGNMTRLNFRLLELDSELLDPPPRPRGVLVQMPSSELVRLVRGMGVVSEELNVRACPSEGVVEMRASGDIGWLEERLASSDAETDVTVVGDEEGEGAALEAFTGRFSLKYMTAFAKGSSISRVVSLSFCPDYPMTVTFAAGGALTVRMMLAPRMDDEGEA